MKKKYQFPIIGNLSIQQKLGLLCFLSIILINQYTWLIIFDADGYLSPVNKNKFLFFNLILFALALFLLFFNLNIYSSKTIRSIMYIIFVFFVIELLSFITIKLLFISDNKIKDRVDYALGELVGDSKNISWRLANLRTDYGLNPHSPKANAYGLRSGGYEKNKESYRIMCIGGSTTFGWSVDDSSDTYPYQLELYLNEKGYNVDIINAGVPYHTSLDMLLRFITFGIYFNPDMLLIHTGGNDVIPQLSPFDYEPDYSHWRSTGIYNHDKIFKLIWKNFPSSTLRLFLIYYFQPGAGSRSGLELYHPNKVLLANTPINNSRATGLINNFSTILSICKSNKITPVTILFNNDLRRTNSSLKKSLELTENQKSYALERHEKCMRLNNSIMDSISKKDDVKVIPFDEFKTSSELFWYDHCHLKKEGMKEKAAFIGQFLQNNFELK